jgi:branched-chain amino acid transport system substrate-binding protein
MDNSNNSQTYYTRRFKMDIKRKRNFMVSACLEVMIFCLLGMMHGNAGAASAKPFKIGYVDSLTGDAAFYAGDSRAGLEVAIDEINAKGGILGRRMELFPRDDKFRPEIALRHAKDLVLEEKVDVVVGTMSSGCALAMTAFLRDQKVPFFVISQSTTTTTEKGHRYVFRISTNTDIYAYADAAAAAKIGLTKWWTMNSDYEYGHACDKAFRKDLKALNPKVEFIGEGWPKIGTADLTPFLTPIMVSDAEALFYNAAAGGGMIPIVKNGKSLGLFKKVTVLGHDMGSTNAYYQFGKGYPEGIWGGTQYPFWEYRKNPRNEAFYQKVLKKRNGAPPALGAPCSYSTLWAIVAAAEKTGSTDTEKIIDTLEGMTIDTLVGPVLIHKYDHQAEWPYFFGRTKYVPEYPIPILTDVMVFKGEGYLTEDQVRKARAEAK